MQFSLDYTKTIALTKKLFLISIFNISIVIFKKLFPVFLKYKQLFQIYFYKYNILRYSVAYCFLSPDKLSHIYDKITPIMGRNHSCIFYCRGESITDSIQQGIHLKEKLKAINFFNQPVDFIGL